MSIDATTLDRWRRLSGDAALVVRCHAARLRAEYGTSALVRELEQIAEDAATLERELDEAWLEALREDCR